MADDELKALQEACAVILDTYVFTEPLRLAKLPVGETVMGGKRNGLEFSVIRTLPRESLLFVMEHGLPKIEKAATEAQERLKRAKALIDVLKPG